MIEVYTSKEAFEKDSYNIENGTPSRVLMERAAAGVCRYLLDCAKDGGGVLIVSGNGNNGGDGFAIAEILQAEETLTPTVLCAFSDTDKMSEECRYRYERCRELGVRFTDSFPDTRQAGITCIVDAIFGTGLSRPIDGRAARLIEQINSAKLDGVKVVSVDIPSGIDGSFGNVCGTAVRADATVTISDYKRGLFIYPGADYAGEIIKIDIGLQENGKKPTAFVPESEDIEKWLPARPRRSNKGTFGKVVVVAGCNGMSGAAYFAAKSAYRVGAGLVEVLTAEENRQIIQTLLPEAIVSTDMSADAVLARLATASSVVVGCGLGTGDASIELMRTILPNLNVPTVIDADGLNLMALHPELFDLMSELQREKTVLTPHPGEMARLCGCDVRHVIGEIGKIAHNFAEKHGITTVLKDAHSVVCDKNGRMSINLLGNSGMATGGSGDVLAGVIGGIMAQRRTDDDCFVSAWLGVLIHSLAGDLAKEKYGEYSMIASDIIEALPEVLKF